MSWLAAVCFLVGFAVVYVTVGAALLRFWNWVEQFVLTETDLATPDNRGLCSFVILTWPFMLVLVAPLSWLYCAAQKHGNPLRGAWTWVLRLAGCKVED
jgi:hypothetical protein